MSRVLQCSSDAFEQILPINRFHHKTVHAELGCHHHVLACLHGTTYDHWEMGEARYLADSLKHVEATHRGHGNVSQNEINRPGGEHFECLHGAFYGERFVA